ncbi:TRAP-type C4-dicarboxylate transport system, small permease component [Alloalcanivorax xenomutans]|uniref:TRAP transporter small permease n=1 Tax=Alloalcanivorax xenomutans TaxID=1094342 RepID=UPI0006D5C841|nr:TRAP transporter small permease [Alloalcanivorax xenomutans]CUR46481.1 TRAP-type C4-dicarboxylate transport system, small permease component [Alloalcanivorax xenomutans]
MNGSKTGAGRPSWSMKELRNILQGRPAEELIGVALMLLLMVITLLNVLIRYLTSQSFAWTEEISVFLLVVMTLAGAAVASVQNAHIRIEFLYSRGSSRRRQYLALLSAIGTVSLFFLLGVLFVRTAWTEFQFGETTYGLGLPRWWYTVFLPPLAFAVAFRAIQAHRRENTDDNARTGAHDEGPL